MEATYKFYKNTQPLHPEVIQNPKSIYDKYRSVVGDVDQESFWLIGLDVSNKIKLEEMIFLGGVDSCTVDYKIIFRRLLMANCCHFIILHNHPSASQNPSSEDIKVTRRIKDIAILLGMSLLDHIIISQNGHYSFSEHGDL